MATLRLKLALAFVAVSCLVCVLTSCGRDDVAAADAPYRFLRAWGGEGHKDGKFASPRALTIDHRGYVYVIDKSGRVQKFTGEGEFLLKWHLPEFIKGKPDGVCVDGEGNVVIADTHYSRILRYSPQGQLLDQFGSYGSGPGQFVFPTGVVLDAEGYTYVCEYGDVDRMQKFDRQHRFLAEWGGHGEGRALFQRPMNLDISSRGELFVADSCNHRIQVFSRTGELLRTFGSVGSGAGQLRFPNDVKLDDQDNVYVCEYGNHRIQKFTPAGDPLCAWGTPGSQPGQLAGPWGVAIDRDGLVYVADTGNHRVQVFEPT
ncbi:MAG: hypothetical protein ACE5R4_12505 [Armatimonadota bacterium]